MVDVLVIGLKAKNTPVQRISIILRDKGGRFLNTILAILVFFARYGLRHLLVLFIFFWTALVLVIFSLVARKMLHR